MRLRRLYRSGLASISFISLSPYRFPIGSCCGMLELCSASLVHSPKAAHAHSDGWTTPFPSPTSHIPPPTTNRWHRDTDQPQQQQQDAAEFEIRSTGLAVCSGGPVTRAYAVVFAYDLGCHHQGSGVAEGAVE